MADPQIRDTLPENAYRELNPGEEYVAMVPAGVHAPEITMRSIIFGIVMNVVFAMAATYLALKVGQGIETAIPISILAIGLSSLLIQVGYRRSTIIENVNILAISTTSGIVAGGTCFTMPAIYLLKLQDKLHLNNWTLFMQIFLVPLLGAVLGVIFLVPFRRYFVREMHGKLPFPEATATNEILVSGTGASKNAIILVYSSILAAAYAFCGGAMKLWTETFSTGHLHASFSKELATGSTGEAAKEAVTRSVDFLAFPALGAMTDKVKALFTFGTGAEFLGLGFIIGVRYAAIICAGSFLSWLVVNPMLAPLNWQELSKINGETKAHGGPIGDEALASLDGNLASRLDFFGVPHSMQLALYTPEERAARKSVETNFAGHNITLDKKWKIVTQKAGQEWGLLSGDQGYRIQANDSAIAVRLRDAADDAEPLFAIPKDDAATLDTADVSTTIRNRVKAGLAEDGVTLGKEWDISVDVDGKRWALKDNANRTYVIKTADDGPQLSVYARTPDAEDIFAAVPRNMGIGCIFAAGLISILKMSKVMVTALREALGSLFRKSEGGATHDRTDQDISYPVLGLLGLGVTAAIALYFYTSVYAGMDDAAYLTFVSIVLALGVSFIFITVSAWAIATISVTPISGMTVTTIIVTAVVLLWAGLGKEGVDENRARLAVLLVGGVVASALSMAGTLVTEFKLGYWAGSTPRTIQWSAILFSVLASAMVTGTIMVLAASRGYDPSVSPEALQAPQANLMKSALESFIGGSDVPFLVYGVGVVLAVLLELVGISPLAFGLGMYLPMELNIPILAGALVAAWVRKGSKSEAEKKARNDKGVLIASGLIAGAAVMGVFLSVGDIAMESTLAKANVVQAAIDSAPDPEAAAISWSRMTNWLGLVAFLVLCLIVFVDARRAKPEPAANAGPAPPPEAAH